MLLVTAGLGVHLEEVVDLPLRDATEVARAFADAAERRAGLPARVDDPLAPRCDRSRRCLGDVAARTDAEHLVFLRLIGGVTKIRVVAVRLDSSGLRRAEAVANLPRQLDQAEAPLDRLAGALFPERVEPVVLPPLITADPMPGEEPSRLERAGPWLVIGFGVAAGVGGTALGLSSASARDRIETQGLTGTEYTDALGQMQDHGTAANVLYGVAVASVLTGIAWLLLR